MTMTRTTLIAALCSATLMGCGSSTGSTSSSGGTSSGGTSGSTGSGSTGGSGTTGGSSSGGSTGSSAAMLCTNPPANNAPMINDSYSASPMPASGTAAGGTIESGTYFMTSVTNYGQASGSGTHKDTLVFDTAASTFVVDEVNTGRASTIAGTYITSGHVLNESLVCPATVTATVEYTAAPGTLTFYNYDAKSVSVWAKQ